jgi:Uncharacterized protein related to capsule biosynthesis enzymes
MSRLAVHYENLLVGELAEARGGVFFEYSPAFIASRHELSPFRLPLGPGVKTRDTPPTLRLPGLFEDSLPDAWGRRVMLEWFRRQGTPEHAVTPLHMLAYVGERAMGALRYTPAIDIPTPAEADLAALCAAAAEAERGGEIDLAVLARAGSSAGGARPKALLHLPDDGEGPPWAGAHPPSGYSPWLVKFDLGREPLLGALEEAFARLARAAGIDLPSTRLLSTTDPDGRPRRHFAVRRFDREIAPDGSTRRVHHHTLAALLHMSAGDLDYQTFLRATRQLTRDEREVWRAYRRAVFNILASNRDDHGKNHGFLYRDRAWTLGPAYDLTPLSAQQLPERGMAVCGERRAAGLDHLRQLAEREGLDRKRALAIIDEVATALRRWPALAAEVGVPERAAHDVTASFGI